MLPSLGPGPRVGFLAGTLFPYVPFEKEGYDMFTLDVKCTSSIPHTTPYLYVQLIPLLTSLVSNSDWHRA